MRNFILLGFLISCALSTHSAFAQTAWLRDTTIVDVRWYGKSGYITTSSVIDPIGCSSNPNGHRIFSDQTVGYKEFLSMAMAAMVASKKVDVLVGACTGEHNGFAGLVVKNQ